jgi:UDPglucose--hexose-1-phosphate uridylyltransferase
MSELRKDPLLERWTLVSPERAERPSEYLEDQPTRAERPCPFCPGRERETPNEILAHRDGTPADAPGWRVRLVPNRFPAISLVDPAPQASGEFFASRPGIGVHEVLIETPDHEGDLGTMGVEQATLVFRALRERLSGLARDTRLAYVLAFENHGASAGATIEHAHAQILGLDFVPSVARTEMGAAGDRYDGTGRCAWCEAIERERAARDRVVRDADGFFAACAFAPRFEYETWIAPVRHATAFEDGDGAQDEGLARALTDVVGRLQSVLQHPAYNFVLHNAPCRSPQLPSFHWHVEVMPRTARLAGFEWGSGVHIVATSPEEAAQRLREAGAAAPRQR